MKHLACNFGAGILAVAMVVACGKSSSTESADRQTGGSSTGGRGDEGGSPSSGGTGTEAGGLSSAGAGTEGGNPSSAGAGTEGGNPSGEGAGAEGGNPSSAGAGAEGGSPSSVGGRVEGGNPSGGGAGPEAGSSPVGNAGAGAGGQSTTALCPAECARLTEPECPDYTLEKCTSDCEFITRLPDCQPEYEAYFDCSDGKTAECNSEGDPHVPGCDLQLAIALVCAWGSIPNQSLEPKCDDYCELVEQTCSDERPDCSVNCQTLGTEGTGCDSLWEDHLDCVAAAETTACPLGIFSAQGCGDSFVEWLTCVNEGSSS